MVKKSDGKTGKYDLTAIGDLSEYIHSDDTEADLKFKTLNETQSDSIMSEITAELPPEIPFTEEKESTEVFHVEETFDSSLIEDVVIDLNTEVSNDFQIADREELTGIQDSIEFQATNLVVEEEAIIQTTEYQKPENFLEVQNFAQNFSYGEIPAGGNPPFSIIVKNIKYHEEAEDILAILREYKIATPENEKEFLRAIGLGILLIPQISEYLAIIITHRIRRFDCEIIMGLADQVQPSRSGEENPRGLTKKSNIHQNKIEKQILNQKPIPITEIISSTTSTLVGYKIMKYIGVETAFQIIESEDLERLEFIQRRLSQTIEAIDNETGIDYSDFYTNFHQIYADLIDEIKHIASQKEANALLGINFTLTPFLSTKNNIQNKYQLTCTATLANVSRETDETL